jgi:hypothetical protein
MTGIFVYPKFNTKEPKAYTIAPVRSTPRTIVTTMEGLAEVVWQTGDRKWMFGSARQRYWIRQHDGVIRYRRVGGDMGWRLIRVEVT